MNLTPEQQRAIDEIENNLQIVACAGSGKTEVITRRIANILRQKPDIKPQNIVAFTFTNKAADSLKSRITAAVTDIDADSMEKMYIGTIHGFCYRLLSEYGDGYKNLRILDSVKNHLFITRYANKCGMSDLDLAPRLNYVKLFCDCIGKMVDDYDNRSSWDEKHAEVFEKARACLREYGYLDYAILILETLEQVKHNPAVAKHLRSIKYLVVDEYQDVDNLQEKLIHYFSEHGANICVVGDDDQTIYQFRGSKADNMIRFAEKYPRVTQVKLEQNFRCSPAVVDIADCVIKNNQNRLEKKMLSESGANAITKAERFDSDTEQYDAIAAEIARLGDGDIAVLVRKGKYINPICEALRKRGIDYSTDSADYFFSGDYFVRFVQTFKILTEVDKAALYKCWQGYIDDEHLSAAFKYLRQTARSGGNGFTMPMRGVLENFLEAADFFNLKSYDAQTRREDAVGFAQILDDYDEIYGDCQLSARILGLLKFLENRALEEYKYHNFKPDAPHDNTVQIMTIHKSKGLEFDTVFIPNMMNREFPAQSKGGRKYWHILGGSFESNKERYESDIDDERKLFYVAVTRAKKNLYLYYELSSKPLSTFVREAAESNYLEIDRDDLREPDMSKAEIAELRKKLLDDVFAMYHAGMKSAILEVDEIKNASPSELADIAARHGF